MNCVRFHYGQCYNETRVCHECGGKNHIERYCPSRNTIFKVCGEPLAGTRAWCDWHGLNADPTLKAKILQSLKTTPGSAIYVNGTCIYRGHEKHFDRYEEPRGRTLEERMGGNRARSRSASPERSRAARNRDRGSLTPSRGRLPIRRNDEAYRQQIGRASPTRLDRYRSRSPLTLRHPSPPEVHDYEPRPPRYATGSNAVVYEAKDQSPSAVQCSSEPPLYPVRFTLPAKPIMTPAAEFALQRRAALGDISNRNSANNPLRPMTGLSASKFSRPQGLSPREDFDPYFVLGIDSRAGDVE